MFMGQIHPLAPLRCVGDPPRFVHSRYRPLPTPTVYCTVTMNQRHRARTHPGTFISIQEEHTRTLNGR